MNPKMTWSLNVGGHTEPAAGEEGWRAAEHRLAEKVKTFLQEIRDEFGVTNSQLHGNYVSQTALHLPDDPEDAADGSNAEAHSQGTGSDEPGSDAAVTSQPEGHGG